MCMLYISGARLSGFMTWSSKVRFLLQMQVGELINVGERLEGYISLLNFSRRPMMRNSVSEGFRHRPMTGWR